MSSFTAINKTQTGNFWELNPHMIYVEPFFSMYNADKTKDKSKSSKDMWCIIWMVDPDEDVNRYYRITDPDERLSICKNFNPDFDENHPLILDALEKYPFLCMDAVERSYKLDKDQLIQISTFLSKQPITLENAKEIIDLKAKLPKIYQDFDKLDKMFQKNKSEQRVLGGRKQTARERGLITPTE